MKKAIEELQHHGRNASASTQYNLRRIVKALKIIEVAAANIRQEQERIEKAINGFDEFPGENKAETGGK